jgi:GTP-binding protein
MSQQRFLDEVKVFFKAGDGGNGCIAFHREKFVPKGGPSGGNGGRGGSVYLVADENLQTLNDFLHGVHFKAPSGQHGMGSRCAGQNAKDMLIHVPRGTLVTDPESGEVLADLAWHGQLYLVARGGIGGRGNASFASHVYRLPRFAQRGEPGEERWARLVLKMIAQVGIVGFPNAGKSTLLSRISRATPRIAPYPFTTLVPNLGMVWLDDARRAVFADIPGLIEGAHQGVGLGDRFLRHVERTRVLVHMIDATTLPADDPLAPYRAIREELRLYGKGLEGRPEVVVLNKIDLPEGKENAERVLPAWRAAGLDPILISAHEGEGLQAVLDAVRTILEREPETPITLEDSEGPTIELAPLDLDEIEDEDEVEPIDLTSIEDFEEKKGGPPGQLIEPPRRRGRSIPARFTVRREGDRFMVEGRMLERMIAMTDLANDEGLRWLQRRLERMGVDDALKQAGATNGSPVVIRGFEFEYQDEEPSSGRPTRKQKRLGGQTRKR